MTALVRGDLRVVILADRSALGAAAGTYAAGRLRELLKAQDRVRVIFAAAASQLETLAQLASESDIDWSRVDAFHLDEYVGLPSGHPQGFGQWLQDRIWDVVRPGTVQRMDGANAAGPEAEAARYGALLADGGIDLALLGIGENGHVAFNDPHVADFRDPLVVKPVLIDETSRHQQVRDGAFGRFEDVPALALTVTMSTLLASQVISLAVPGPQKVRAVAATLDGPVSTSCPASALRDHPDATLFVDEAAASLVARA
ncbi:MAG: 6-phosphogluconolactonase [Chloroflexi bacterium]|nr:6-phosphogluconolactonase [Chloroflexota bacterium]